MQPAVNHFQLIRNRAAQGVITFALLLAAPELFAQAFPTLGQLTARQRADLSELNTSEDLDNPIYISVGDDQDENIGSIKILREGNVYRPLRFHLTNDWFWTDNAALSSDSIPKLKDHYFATSVGVSYVPRIASPFPTIGTDLYMETTASFGTFRYDNNSFLDFNTVDTGLGLVQVFRGWGDLSLYGKYKFQGLINPDRSNVFFDEHALVFGIYKPFDIIPGHYFYTRLETKWALDTNPAPAEFDEYHGTLGYRYFHSQKLHADLYYRFRYLDFNNLGDNDLVHHLGLGVSYEFNEYISLGAAYNFAENDSTRPLGDYTVNSLGGSVFLQIRM